MKKILLLTAILVMIGHLLYAATTTTYMGLYQPGVGDRDWGDLVNANFDTTDDWVGPQHNSDGTHSAITGDSLVVTGAVTAGSIGLTGALTCTSIDTGQGANEVYAMDQDVQTTDAVTFASVDTGQGANELYAMDQDVETTDAVTYDDITLSNPVNVYALSHDSFADFLASEHFLQGDITTVGVVTVGDVSAIEADPSVDSAAKIEAILTDNNFDFGTGIVTATGFSGPLTGNVTGDVSGSSGSCTGNAATATTASAGDSATAFFSAGTIEHEYGGLEANVSAYGGLLAVSGGSTSEANTKALVEAQLTDVTDLAEADGDTWTGVHDMGGATTLEIPNATDPDVSVAGQISADTDDNSLRGYDGTNQFAYGQKDKTVQFSVMQPDDLDETLNIPGWSNETGFSFILTEIKSWSDVDDATFTLKEVTGTNWTATTTIEAITVSDNGTGIYYDTVASGDIDHTTIENGNHIIIDPSADDLKFIKVTIKGYLNADVD